jgi:hypothetical protein
MIPTRQTPTTQQRGIPGTVLPSVRCIPPTYEVDTVQRAVFLIESDVWYVDGKGGSQDGGFGITKEGTRSDIPLANLEES